MSLRRAHVRAYLVFDVLCQPHHVRQAGELFGFDADCGREPAELGLAVGLGRRDLGRAARFLQRQHGVQLGAFGGRTACGWRRE